MSLKPLICSLLCVLTSIAICFAGPDTTKTPLLAMAAKSNAVKVVIKTANVIYPENLEKHQEEFIPYVEKFAQNRRNYLVRTYTRGKNFFPKAQVILKKYNVPKEFAVLMALESAFNGEAISPAGAVGYWQIMDEVAKEYGLVIITDQKPGAVTDKNKKPVVVDDRKNFLKSTHTAGKYLQNRMRNLNNDWLLVAASYNWGVGNVWKAMDRTGKSNPTFWDIQKYLPAETKSYVMNFIALNVIFANYEKFRDNDLCFKDIVANEKEIPISVTQ